MLSLLLVWVNWDESFKISQGDLSLVLNPSSKISADITLFTSKNLALPAEALAKAGFVITGPGEYEIKDIFIKGFPDRTFLITFEGIKLCFLGSQAEQDEVDDIDILFVPVSSYKSAVALEPAMMIPMGYDKITLAQFLKEAGEKEVEPLDKLVVKKKDLEGKEGEVVVLKQE